MEKEYEKDFFKFNRWILQMAGLWIPNNSNFIQIAYKLYAISVFLFVNLWFTSTEFVSLFHTFTDEDAFIKNINFFLTHFMGAVKVVFWYFRGSCLIDIIGELQDEKLHYDNSANFRPGLIYNRHKKVGAIYTLLFLGLAHATLTSSYIPPIVTVFKHMRNQSVVLPEKLPYYCWMPFSYETAALYLLALAYQAGPMFSYAYSVVGVDTLYMNIINCIGANLSIIQNAFATIDERCEPSERQRIHANNSDLSDVKMRKMSIEFIRITKHLQATYRLCEYLETLYRFVSLCQVGATLFILCTCLYLVSTNPLGSKQFFAELVYMIAMFFQLFVYCWFGNEVTIKSGELSAYMWRADWLSANIAFKRNTIFAMTRSTRPVYFTAGKFVPLTLSTFMSIIKTSYSIFALIKNTTD